MPILVSIKLTLLDPCYVPMKLPSSMQLPNHH
jgi:hypothetical protein